MSRRSRVRQVVVQLLYQDEVNPVEDSHWEAFLRKRLNFKPDLVEFGERLFRGVKQSRDRLDDMIGRATNNWRVSRMAAIDRNVIRLGAFEILYLGTPVPVAINEAIELARRFGDQDSPQFVNGVLDRVFRNEAPNSTASASNDPTNISSNK